jgi:FtsP/CotA-like multicopper oxidase with cupredoxin domain
VVAFGEEGGQPQIPGPLVRVAVGTTIRVRVRNTLPDTLYFHGLAGPGAADSLIIPPGATAVTELRTARLGNGFYWATSSATDPMSRFARRKEATLSGALVVDSPGPVPNDRILVISSHLDTVSATGEALRDERNSRVRLFLGMNGLSWPHTERLHYAMGDSVRWRVINASSAPHPMHLHGFYFRVDAHGDAARDTIYDETARRMVVTELLLPGETMSMTWSPNRPGGWLFHCHITHHMSPHAPVDDRSVFHAVADHHAASGGAMAHAMGGMVMAVDVSGRLPARRAEPVAQRLELVVRSDSDATSPWRRYGYVAGSAAQATTQTPPTGPVLVMRRGVSTAVTVVNEMSVPSAVHWHGIELESYFDGVAGVGGDSARRTPMIAPGERFEARMTPPRAGTFMYHTHVDEMAQQAGGLVGAIIVLEPGVVFDPVHDLPLLVSDRPDGRAVRLNGRDAPAPLQLRVGERYRLRLINIAVERAATSFRLMRDSVPVTWRPIAKDGFDLPPGRAHAGPAIHRLASGETVDVEFIPDAVGDLTLQFIEVLPRQGGRPGTEVLMRVPVRIR